MQRRTLIRLTFYENTGKLADMYCLGGDNFSMHPLRKSRRSNNEEMPSAAQAVIT